jgi:Derlin-2/3
MRCVVSLLDTVSYLGTVDQISKLTHPVWYYFNDIFPPLHNGRSPLDPPAWWIRLFDGPPAPTEETHDDDAAADHVGNPNEAVPDAVPAQ